MDYTEDELEIFPPGQEEGPDTGRERPAQTGFLREHHLVGLERFLDSQFVLPGTNFKFGFDALIGLIPVLGDVFTGAMSSLIIADALKRGARKRILAAMVGNVIVDMMVGAIPLIGDWFDFAFRASTKNLKLHRKEFGKDGDFYEERE